MNKLFIISSITLMLSFSGFSQTKNIDSAIQKNAAQTLLTNKQANKLTIGMYGQVDYNEPEGSLKGTMDVHRMVLLLGYNFTDNVQFLTEIEYEHVKEVFIEQAFLNYRVANNFNVKAGLMLVPMGIINEYHESTTFFGVERPSVDHDIIPTTWREIGIGVSGKIKDVPLKYQAYIFNGFNSDNLRGKDGLRKGRQKGVESVISSPTFSGKLDYYGVSGLRLGASTYFGKTQTALKNEVSGATVGVFMIGFDARYVYKKFKARGQYISTTINGAKEYNSLNNSDLGSKMYGWYLEAGYNVLSVKNAQKFFPFIRYEQYDTHAKTEGIPVNKAYNREILTTGINYDLADGITVKVDYQFKKNQLYNTKNNQFNAGIAFWF